jgi:hypothetical protein
MKNVWVARLHELNSQLPCLLCPAAAAAAAAAAPVCWLNVFLRRPNCEAKAWMVGTVSRHVVICAARDIAAGEELT